MTVLPQHPLVTVTNAPKRRTQSNENVTHGYEHLLISLFVVLFICLVFNPFNIDVGLIGSISVTID